MSESSEELREASLVPLVRYFFALPEPVGLPDGYRLVVGEVGDLHAPDWVSLVIHQVSTSSGRTAAAVQAVVDACDKAGGLPSRGTSSLGPDIEAAWSVVEAMTPGAVDLQGSDQEKDPFMRCREAADQLVRAYRLATEHPCGPPSYVRIPFPVLAYSTEGLIEQVCSNGFEMSVVRPSAEPWIGPSVVLLDHFNLGDPVRETHDDELEALVDHWLMEQALQNPLLLGRERLIEARRAHHILVCRV